MELTRKTARTVKTLVKQEGFSYSTLNSKGEECFTLNLFNAKEEYNIHLTNEEIDRLKIILNHVRPNND